MAQKSVVDQAGDRLVLTQLWRHLHNCLEFQVTMSQLLQFQDDNLAQNPSPLAQHPFESFKFNQFKFLSQKLTQDNKNPRLKETRTRPRQYTRWVEAPARLLRRLAQEIAAGGRRGRQKNVAAKSCWSVLPARVGLTRSIFSGRAGRRILSSSLGYFIGVENSKNS